MRNKIWKNGVMLALILACFTYIVGFVYAEPLTVAVLGFESKEKVGNDFTTGTKIADLLTAELYKNPNISLVEREKVTEALTELGLSKAGIVSDNQALQVAQFTGAKILITGRAFNVDKDLVIVAKIISAETSKVKVATANGSSLGELAPIVKELSQKVSDIISKEGPTMVVTDNKKEDTKDIIATIKDKIGEKARPKVLVAISERHVGGEAIDPTAETEFTYILNNCGFTVSSKEGFDLSNLAKVYIEDGKLNIPLGIDADVVIVGEAFSEYGTTNGKLISCKARVEIQAIDINTRETLAVDRETSSAVDLSEQITAKAAIQKASDDIASRIIPELVEKWNSKK